MKNVVIISPYFPPSNLAGVHRARHLAKHLPAAGWHPIILCVDEAYHEEHLDPDLAKLVPTSVEIVKVKALSAKLTRCFGLGEISLRAFCSLRRSLFHLLETRQIDVVFITGSPYYPMLLANTVEHRFRVPVVLDFQDPWVSAWGAVQPRLSKAGLSHWLATRFEPRALRGASYITSVSETQNVELVERYPWLDAERMVAIPIGSDPEDFALLGIRSQVRDCIVLGSGYFNISYVGTIWPMVEPTLRALLRGLAALRVRQPSLYAKMRLIFVGTSANPNDISGYRVLPMAKAAGVDDIVFEIPQRRPYWEALDLIARSAASLMLGSIEPHYTASKIYSNLMSGRPFLSLFHSASSAHGVLSAAGGGIALSFSTQKDLGGMEGRICDGLVRLATSPTSLGQADPAIYGAYDAASIAVRFADIFDTLVSDNS